MISRKSSSQLSTTSSGTSSSRKSSVSPASALTEWDVEEKDIMSADEYIPSRPLSVAIPAVSGIQGPYCPRRPNLREILANTAPAPWTLAAFMAYLSNNHCLETLEFTMDAGRYRKHYAKMLSRATTDGLPPSKDRDYVNALWQRLVQAYIQPSGSREVNLPSDVRDPILATATNELPPPPETLDRAVAKIYELMEDSVLVPFLNSAYPQSAYPATTSLRYNASDENLPLTARAHEDRSTYSRHTRHARSSPPPQSAVEPHAHTYSAPSALNRKSAPSTLTTGLNKARFSTKLSPTSSASTAPAANMGSMDSVAAASDANISLTPSGSGPGMSDDSGSASSPTNESPMTPPMSPPTSGDGHSPKRDSGMWKKLGRLSGMKVGRKKSQGGLKEEP